MAPVGAVVTRERPTRVRVTLRDGQTLDLRGPALRVDPATGDTMLAGSVFDAGRGRAAPAVVPVRDVATVAVWGPDGRRTAVLIGGVASALAAFVALAAWAFGGEIT